MGRVSSSSAALRHFLPFKTVRIFNSTCRGFSSSRTVKPRSANTKSYGLRCFMMPLSSKIGTSSISTSHKSEIKQAPPLGVTAIRHLNVLECLYDKKVFPYLAKFLEHSTLNSVQSTMHRIFFMVLNTLGRNLLSWALCENMKFCMSRKVTYINWMKVVKIFRTCDASIFLSGVLRRAERVLTVNPLFSLRRQINSFRASSGIILCRTIFSGPIVDGLQRTNRV